MSELKMSLGMPTLVELNTIEENVKLCTELGLDFIEINMNLPQYQTQKLNIDELLTLQRRSNIFFTFHLPEDLCIAHFNDKIREAHWETVIETLDVMKEIRSPIINMHIYEGIHFKLPDRKIYLYDKYYEEYNTMIVKFRDAIDDYIKDSSIKIAIENIGIYDKEFTQKAVSRLLESDNFVLTWDIGHDYTSGNKDKDFISSNLDKLGHMHIHDAVGERCHLVLYDGEMNIDEKLNLARSKRLTSVIETKTIKGLKKSALELKNRGYML